MSTPLNLYPAIDLRDGKVVRLEQGRFDQQTSYHDDPVAQAVAFEKAGARYLHMVDLDGARHGRMLHLDVIRAVCESTSLTVQVGGGVRSEGAIDVLIEAGVARVILGTAALKNWAWFESLMGNPTYRGKLVLGLDARDGKLAVDGWEQTSDTQAVNVARQVSDWPLAAIVYTDIARDGMMVGNNVQATAALAEATDVPIIASGGIGSLEHLQQLTDLPIDGVIVGKALYENAFTVEQAIDTLRR